MLIDTPPAVVLRVDESASVTPSDLTLSESVTITTAPDAPMVAVVLPLVVALERALLTEMPAPTTERICDTVALMPCAMTLRLLAPAVSGAPDSPTVRMSPAT